MSFGSSSAPPPPPTQTTTRQVPEYAPEQREYVSDIFGKAQELYEQRTEEGFQPFPGAQLAPFAPQEQEAFRGIESLARGPGAAPAFEVARTAALGAAAPVTAGEIQGLMNPYQQAVTDIAKREAVRQYQRGPQAQLRTGAVEAGGLRGSRRFIEEAEGQRNLQQQLSDIQTMGGQQAYNQAMAEAAAARGRLANLATQMPSIGTGAYQQQMAQLGQLGGVGEAQRAREQAAIDLAKGQFQQELMFPEETLATYLRFITNAPSPSGFQQTRQTPTVPGPSALQQLAGLGISGAAAGKAFNLFNRGGAVPPASGRQAGLSGIVRRAGGGQIVRMEEGGGIFDRIVNYKGIGNFMPSMSDIANVPIVRDIRKALTPQEGMRGTIADIYDIAGEGVEYLTGIDTPSATEAIMNLGYTREEAARIAGEGKGIGSGIAQSLGGDIKGIVGDAPLRMSDLVLPDGTDVGDYEETVAYKSAPKPKPKPETIREDVDQSIDNLNRRSGDVGDKPRLDDAAYLDIAAAALKGAYEPGTIGRETGFVESLGKVLSPAAAAAAAGMRQTKKTQREEEALEMARRKEDREAGAQEFINDLRKSQAAYYSAKPEIDKLTARNKYAKLIIEGIDNNTIPEKEGQAELLRILGPSAMGAGSGDPSDGSLASGRTRDLG